MVARCAWGFIASRYAPEVLIIDILKISVVFFLPINKGVTKTLEYLHNVFEVMFSHAKGFQGIFILAS